ncbi:hypothetical protein ACSAMQ_03970, partial [Lysobacter sp. 1R34A]
MSGLWSAEQREWLQAMGHSVMTLAADQTEAPAAEVELGGVLEYGVQWFLDRATIDNGFGDLSRSTNPAV